MKKQIGKRSMSFALVLSIFASLLVGISPLGFSSNAVVDSVASLGDVFKSAVNSVVGAGKVAADVLDQAASAVSFRYSLTNTNLVTPDELLKYVDEFNSLSWLNAALATNNSLRSVYEQAQANLNNSWTGRPYAYPRPDPASGNSMVRPYIDGYGWLVDVNGHYPYCDTDEYNSRVKELNSGLTTSKPFDGRWLTTNSIRDSKKLVQKSYADLDATKADLANKHPNSSVTISTLKVGNLECKVIRRLEEGPGNRDWVWCDPNGRPYVYIDPSTQGAAQDWNYDKIQEITNNQTQDIKDIVNEQGDKIDKLIDLDSNVTLAPSVSVDPNLEALLKLNIDQVVIDRSDNGITYTVDSHDVTYNTTLNYYEYNYYTYNYQYTYNNTYVTYIGSTAEYQPKEWAFYYELPDGRSSADLTEEDIAGLSFQFADMVNYKQSAADTSLRALYHFDGNTVDSSYWTNQGSFSWNKGASITYMESNAFNGALYLDEKAHGFTITLPSSIGSSDFTLQWRYYQNSATTTDHNENFVSIGGDGLGTKLLSWSEQYLYGLGTQKYSTGLSVGTWQELALVRHNSQLYFYHNGVALGSVSMPTVFNDKIEFLFGENSRAYSMIDELRFVNFAVAKSGASYTPTAVPHDTNNVLVLPDGTEPVADEFWQWDTKITPVSAIDMTTGYIKSTAHTYQNGVIYGWNNFTTGSFLTTDPRFVVCNSDSVSISNPTSSVIPSRQNFSSIGTNTIGFRNSGVAIVLSTREDHVQRTVTLVDKDLNRYSCTFNGSWQESADFSWGTMRAGVAYYDSGHTDAQGDDIYYGCIVLVLDLKPNTSIDFVYCELVNGAKANTGHKFVSAVYSSDEIKPNTAAIQSSIPVKGYTVGGVRPTFPERGDVWMPVEGSRISGVYIYNGQAWEESNARYWTGKRWIPIYAFDLVTLADMWDVGSSTGEDVIPSINSEYGFWNWWKTQWLDFRKWLAENLGGGSGSVVFPSPSECEHTYKEEILTEPTCTRKGSALYVCSKCGDSYTDTVDASGHDWLLVESVPDTFGPGYADITDNFIVGVPTSLPMFATLPNLLDEDPATVHRSTVGAPFKLSSTSAYTDTDMVVKVEFDFIIDGELVTIPLLTPLPHFDPAGEFSSEHNNVISRDVEYGGTVLCTFTFSYGVYQASGQVSGYTFNFGPGESFSKVEGDGLPAFAEIRFYADGPGDPIPGTGYDLYRCSVCGEEYKDYDRVGPPGTEDSSTLSELIQKLFDSLGSLVGSLIDWVLDLAAEAMDGFASLGEYFEEKAEEVKGFGGEYVGFLGVFFEVIPPEIKSCITLALILFGLGLFIRKVIL